MLRAAGALADRQRPLVQRLRLCVLPEGQALQNLGNVYTATGRHAEARALFERALAIQEKSLGRDHPEVADNLQSLAAAHLALSEAVPVNDFETQWRII